MKAQRRKAVFAIAAFVMFGLTAALTLLNPDPRRAYDLGSVSPASATSIGRGSPPVVGSTETQSSSGAAAAPTSTGRTSSPEERWSEQEATGAPAVASREGNAATAAARLFLAGYLRYSYGRAGAQRIRSAARSLLRELEGSAPRVSEAVARARPRLISVQAQAATTRLEIHVRALVDDGQRRYRIPLSVRGLRGRWVVTAVGG